MEITLVLNDVERQHCSYVDNEEKNVAYVASWQKD